MKKTIKKVKNIGDFVAMDHDLGHFNIFSIGPERPCGKRVQTTSKFEYWEFHSTQHPLFSDFGVYLGVLKAFEVFEYNNKVIKIGEDECIEISKNELCKFCGMEQSGQNLKKLDETLLALDLFTARRFRNFGDNKEVKKFKLLEIPKIKEKKGRSATITIKMSAKSRAILKNKKKSMLVQYKAIQAIKGQIERAIFVYVENNDCKKWIPQNWLFRFFGMTPPPKPAVGAALRYFTAYEQAQSIYIKKKYEVVRQIKQGLESLLAKKLIKNFNIEEKPQGTFYKIEKYTYAEIVKRNKENRKAAAKNKKIEKKALADQRNFVDFKEEEIPY